MAWNERIAKAVKAVNWWRNNGYALDEAINEAANQFHNNDYDLYEQLYKTLLAMDWD